MCLGCQPVTLLVIHVSRKRLFVACHVWDIHVTSDTPQYRKALLLRWNDLSRKAIRLLDLEKRKSLNITVSFSVQKF